MNKLEKIGYIVFGLLVLWVFASYVEVITQSTQIEAIHSWWNIITIIFE